MQVKPAPRQQRSLSPPGKGKRHAHNAVRALASAGLSFGAESFGNGYRADEIKLYKLVRVMSLEQKKVVENYLVEQGMVRGGGTAR